MSDKKNLPSAEEISEWIISRLAADLKCAPEQLDVTRPMSQLGIDSTEAVVLSGDLQEWLHTRIPPTVAWDHPTIEALSKHLAQILPKNTDPS